MSEPTPIDSELLARVEARASVMIGNCPPEAMSRDELFTLWSCLLLKKQIEQDQTSVVMSVDSERQPEVGPLEASTEPVKRRPGRPRKDG